MVSENSSLTLTKPQVAVNNILDSMGIAYRNEEPFTYYAVDNYLTDLDLIIEVMGDYWHGSPMKYGECLNKRQTEVVARDKAKRTFIRRHYGIEILYIWENDALKNPLLCQSIINEYIHNNGHLKNYNSFNYYIDNAGCLQLNEIIIYPYQERTIAS